MSSAARHPTKPLPDDLTELRHLRDEVSKVVGWAKERYRVARQDAFLEQEAKRDANAGVRYDEYLHERLKNAVTAVPSTSRLKPYLDPEQRHALEEFVLAHLTTMAQLDPEATIEGIKVIVPSAFANISVRAKRGKKPKEKVAEAEAQKQAGKDWLLYLEFEQNAWTELLDRINEKIEGQLGKIGSVADEGQAQMPALRNVFRFDGTNWEVKYENESFLLNKGPGCYYISTMLSKPKHNFGVVELRQLYIQFCHPSGNVNDKSTFDERVSEADLREGVDDLGDLITEEGLAAIRREIEQTKKDISAAEYARDPEKIEQLKAKKRELEDYAHKSHQPNRRRRKLKARVKTDRDQVRNAIDRTLKIIKKKAPATYLHLHNSLKRSPSYSYVPEKPTCWNT